ncbi:hypothetical protein FQU75_05180 [Paenibacillus polymyxa]|nr:hypothetical protein FQU75_05180 [Paenibacillus polymyxa]
MKQTKIIATVRVVRPYFGIRAPEGREAFPLAAILRFGEAVWLHLVSFRTDRGVGRRNLDVTVCCRILLAVIFEINARLDVLVIEKQIDRSAP